MAQVVIIQSFLKKKKKTKQNLSLMILEVYLITKNHCLKIIALFFMMKRNYKWLIKILTNKHNMINM